VILKLIAFAASFGSPAEADVLEAWTAEGASDSQPTRPPRPPRRSRTVPPPPITTVQPPPPPMPVYYPPAPYIPPVAPPPPPPPTQRPSPVAPPSPARLRAGSISNDDYPPAAIRAEQQGTTTALISVGADGRVQRCEIAGSSGSAILDETTCRLITRRFRYQPAVRDGQPTASTVRQRVTWRLPEDEAPQINFLQGRFTQIVTGGPAGFVDCRIEFIGPTFSQYDLGQCEWEERGYLIEREVMGPGHPVVRVTSTLTLLPEGEALQLPRLGAATAETLVEFEAGADGRITSCETLIPARALPDYVVPRYLNLCERLTAGVAFVPDPEQPVRRGRMQAAVFVELRPAGRR
jgi:periplasmic protein TonB